MLEVASQNSPAEKIEYYGFATFGEKDNSRMKNVSRKLESTGCKFRLFKGNSIKPLSKTVTRLPLMDLTFIDRGHSLPNGKSNWENSKNLMDFETAVFFPNYNLPGPKRPSIRFLEKNIEKK